MNSEYWLQRWQENRIGFHRTTVNPLLTKFWARVVGSEPARVLVPLCGKSVDLAWLRDQGHDVTGVELSDQAARAFFEEQHLEPTITIAAPLRVYRIPRLTYYEGDFFALSARIAGRFDAIYDRAALIALPSERRPAYVAHLGDLIAPHGRTLLITLEYDQMRMAGPPFSVLADEVRTLFAPHGEIEELFVHDCLEEEPRFKERGLEWMTERVFQINHSRK